MKTNSEEFDKHFSKLEEFYELSEPQKVYCFIKKHEKLMDLLEITEPHLKETFPYGKFELEVYCDLSGEGNHSLLLNIHVDNETFNNGFSEKIHEINTKIRPMKKEMNLLMELVLTAGVRTPPTNS